jgi:Kef-type K+ transport system membrane component KefB/Trk K+ transport system NAD-binding subunit
MQEQAFVELSLVILTTLVICGFFKALRQPIMIGYIVSGIVLSPNLTGILSNSEGLSTFSQIGITFLLFMVGLGLNPKHIKDIGKTALMTALGQLFITGGIVFLLSKQFGFDDTTAIYIGLGLSFSSTIVIMKMLTDKLTIETLPGKISIGILIIQDLIAMAALMIISAIAKNGDLATTILETIAKGAILIGVLAIISNKILPIITTKIAKSQEMLLLFSIAWCMAVASMFFVMDFSIEIGALLAGVTLSLSPYRYEISSKMRPLRDFFIMLFFVFLGSQIVFNDISSLILPIITLSLLILIINPIIISFIIGRMGYTKKTSFLAGINFSQISEFSLIVVALGVNVGQLDQKILSLLTLVALISITGSTYFIMYSEKIYRKLNKQLDFLEKHGKKLDEHKHFDHAEHDIILIGHGKMGISLIESFNNIGKNFFVIDYDPRVIHELNEKNIDCLYADVSNLDTYSELNIDDAKMIISSIKDAETNHLLINTIRQKNLTAIIIVLAHESEEALQLYEQGADHVIMPFHIGGEHTSEIISKYGFNTNKFHLEKKRHISKLLIRKGLKRAHKF